MKVKVYICEYDYGDGLVFVLPGHELPSDWYDYDFLGEYDLPDEFIEDLKKRRGESSFAKGVIDVSYKE